MAEYPSCKILFQAIIFLLYASPFDCPRAKCASESVAQMSVAVHRILGGKIT